MYFEDLTLDQTATSTNIVTQANINAFADVSGDHNPMHLDPEFASKTAFKGVIAHGMLSASYISAILGTQLPGQGSVYVTQSLKFCAPVRPDDTVLTTVRVKEIRPVGRSSGEVVLETTCQVGDTVVLEGEAFLKVPRRVKLTS